VRGVSGTQGVSSRFPKVTLSINLLVFMFLLIAARCTSMHSELPGSPEHCYSDVDTLVSPTFFIDKNTVFFYFPPPCIFPFSFAPSVETVMMCNEAYRAQPTEMQTQDILMAEYMRLREE
jgi:hypothetical protein